MICNIVLVTSILNSEASGYSVVCFMVHLVIQKHLRIVTTTDRQVTCSIFYFYTQVKSIQSCYYAVVFSVVVQNSETIQTEIPNRIHSVLLFRIQKVSIWPMSSKIPYALKKIRYPFGQFRYPSVSH